MLNRFCIFLFNATIRWWTQGIPRSYVCSHWSIIYYNVIFSVYVKTWCNKIISVKNLINKLYYILALCLSDLDESISILQRAVLDCSFDEGSSTLGVELCLVDRLSEFTVYFLLFMVVKIKDESLMRLYTYIWDWLHFKWYWSISLK